MKTLRSGQILIQGPGMLRPLGTWVGLGKRPIKQAGPGGAGSGGSGPPWPQQEAEPVRLMWGGEGRDHGSVHVTSGQRLGSADVVLVGLSVWALRAF